MALMQASGGIAINVNDEWMTFFTELGAHKGKGGGAHDIAILLKVGSQIKVNRWYTRPVT